MGREEEPVLFMCVLLLRVRLTLRRRKEEGPDATEVHAGALYSFRAPPCAALLLTPGQSHSHRCVQCRGAGALPDLLSTRLDIVAHAHASLAVSDCSVILQPSEGKEQRRRKARGQPRVCRPSREFSIESLNERL